jgi:hypothetical protein
MMFHLDPYGYPSCNKSVPAMEEIRQYGTRVQQHLEILIPVSQFMHIAADMVSIPEAQSSTQSTDTE